MTAPPDPFKRADRDLACQEALEPQFQSLADAAEREGWTGDEVAGALVALALANIKTRVGAAAVARAIKQARASIGEQ